MRCFASLLALLFMACAAAPPDAGPIDLLSDPAPAAARPVDERALEGGPAPTVVRAPAATPEETVEETVEAEPPLTTTVFHAPPPSEMDLQFAELSRIEGLTVTRPYPARIVIEVERKLSEEMVGKVVAVFVDREMRDFSIEGPGRTALQTRDALVNRGLVARSIRVSRNEHMTHVVVSFADRE